MFCFILLVKQEPYEVYAIDIAMSTGKGKPIERDARTTVFKRAIDAKYKLKMKASRVVLSEIDKLYPALPFSTSLLSDTRQAKLGMKECIEHNLLQSYPVLWEKEGDHVAHVKFTVLIMPNGKSFELIDFHVLLFVNVLKNDRVTF